MAVKYHVLARKNPQDLLAPEKFYAAAIANGRTNLDRLAALISYQCTVTEADCLAVLVSLEHNIIEELAEGRIVEMGRVGNFQIGLSSEGKELPQEVTAASIIKSRILFRPGKRLRTLLKSVTYNKGM